MVTTVMLFSTKGLFWALKNHFEVEKDYASESLANIAL
jgi:hypothetical protein